MLGLRKYTKKLIRINQILFHLAAIITIIIKLDLNLVMQVSEI
jgi:hypothetical protein